MEYDEKCTYGFKTQEVQGLTHKVKACCITNDMKMSANTSTNFLLYTIISLLPFNPKVTIIYSKISLYVSSYCYLMHLYDVSKTIFI
jgi:hypothetical protein